MFSRPKPGETEEDLFKQEDEFLKSSGNQPPRKRTTEDETNPQKPATSEGLLGDIIEKKQSSSKNFHFKAKPGEVFLEPFKIDPSVCHKRSKKSLFALQMEKSKGDSQKVKVDSKECAPSSTLEPMEVEEDSFHGSSKIILTDQDIKMIHEENINTMSKMSHEEILKEQMKLKETLDPGLLHFLTNRSKKKEVRESAKESKKQTEAFEKSEISDTNEEGDTNVKSKLSAYIGKDWLSMDYIEKEKLEWVGDIPDAKTLEPDQPYSARFDFNGELQPFKTEIDVTKSLHHHGDEPERPGYTIQELYQLSRSSVLQQRNLALNTLSNIIRKTKLGFYDKCFDGVLLTKLVESDLFFLLRFSIDENSLIPASVNCLQQLFASPTDELCLDKLLGTTDVDQQPLLFIKPPTTEDEEKELKDHTLISYDLVKGVLRTDLLVRLSYILNNLNPTREIVINIFQTLIRISRHSLKASRSIISTSNLLDFVYANVNCAKPVHQGVKLFRVLISHSKELAWSLHQNYSMKFLLDFVDTDNMDLSKSEMYHLKLESIYLWRCFLSYDLMNEEFQSWTPCFVRLLRFFMDKVNVSKTNDFDFELFSSLASLFITSLRKKVVLDPTLRLMLSVCLEKWLTQLIQCKEYNFSLSKAIGCALRFFVNDFRTNGVVRSDTLVPKMDLLLSRFFHSDSFKIMSAVLCKYSYLLSSTTVQRDPKNLPSLCSIYHGGRDYLRIIHNESPFPLFYSLSEYLICTYNIDHNLRGNIELLIYNSNVLQYVNRFCETKQSSEWFTRFEKRFLVNLFNLKVVMGSEDALRFGFALIPSLPVDEDDSKRVFQLVCSSVESLTEEKFTVNLSSVFSEVATDVQPNPGVAQLYNCDLIPEEWMYKPLSVFRNTERTSETADTLRFIALILENKKDLLRVPHSLRFHLLSTVFLTDHNVFDSRIQISLEKNLMDVIANREKIDLDKSFYDLYTEVITQYAGMSYGAELFGKFVMFPLQNRFDVSFRKLLWFEYLHVMRVVTLPFPMDGYLKLSDFVEPCETDESLLVNYLKTVSNNVITKKRNPFVYHTAVANIKKYLDSTNCEEKLHKFLFKQVVESKNEDIKSEILN